MKKRKHKEAVRNPNSQKREERTLLPKKQELGVKRPSGREFSQTGCFGLNINLSLYKHLRLRKKDLAGKGIGKGAVDFVHETGTGIFPYDHSAGFFGNIQHCPFHLRKKTSFISPSLTTTMHIQLLTLGVNLTCSFQSIPKGAGMGEGQWL